MAWIYVAIMDYRKCDHCFAYLSLSLDEKSMQSICSSSEQLYQNGVEQHYSVPVINASTMPYSEISHYELPQHDYVSMYD